MLWSPSCSQAGEGQGLLLLCAPALIPLWFSAMTAAWDEPWARWLSLVGDTSLASRLVSACGKRRLRTLHCVTGAEVMLEV